VPLAGIVEKAARRTSSSVTPRAQRRDDVEAVASVGDVHRIEQRELRRREPLDEPQLARRRPRAP
jgi:hypothetical protein